MADKFVAGLLDIISGRFNEEELKTLCFKLPDLDYDNLDGNGKEAKIREILSYYERTDIQILIKELKKDPKMSSEIEELKKSINNSLTKEYPQDKISVGALFGVDLQKPTDSKILFISANPASSSNLALKEEYNKIQSRISESPNRDRVQLVAAHDLERGELFHILSRYKPDFIHFAGSAQDRQLILYDKNNPVQVPFDNVIRTLAGVSKYNPIKCVFLNACNTETLAEALTSYVKCAIGVQGEISDEAAIDFAVNFYTALIMNDESIEDSYNAGIQELKMTDSPDISKPVIKSRSDIKPSELFLINHHQ